VYILPCVAARNQSHRRGPPVCPASDRWSRYVVELFGGKGSRGTGVGVPGQGNPRTEGGFPENTVCEHQAYMVGGLRTREIP